MARDPRPRRPQRGHDESSPRAPTNQYRPAIAMLCATLFVLTAFGIVEYQRQTSSASPYPKASTGRHAAVKAPTSATSTKAKTRVASAPLFTPVEIAKSREGTITADRPLADFQHLPTRDALARAPNGDDSTQVAQRNALAVDSTPASSPPIQDDAFTKVTDLGNGRASVSISAAPERAQVDGVWVPIDNTIHDTGSVLMPSAATGAPQFTRTGATGPDYSFATSAGRIAVSYPGATPGEPVVAGNTVRYPGALGGRDLTFTVTAAGVEDSVVLLMARQGADYEVVYTMPKGLKATKTSQGLEFRSGKSVVAAVANGTAFDAAGATTPARVTSVQQKGNVARVRVEIDNGWLNNAARKFPVTIDPTTAPITGPITQQAYATGTSASNVVGAQWSGGCPGGALNVGTYFTNGGGYGPNARFCQSSVEVKFNLGFWTNLGNLRVENANVDLRKLSGSCSGVTAYQLADANHTPFSNIAADGTCDSTGNYMNFDIKAAAQSWVYKDPANTPKDQQRSKTNYGITLRPTDGFHDALNNCHISTTIVPYGGVPNLGNCPNDTATWHTFSQSYAPHLNLTVEYLSSKVLPSEAWTRFSGARTPGHMTFTTKVQNIGLAGLSADWTPGGPYQLQALYTTDADLANAHWTNLGIAGPQQAVKPGQWGDFTVTAATELGPGSYALLWTMVDTDARFPYKGSDPFCGRFDAKFMCYGANQSKLDRLTITSTSSVGADPGAAFSNGVNTFSGNYLRSETDFSITGLGPALELKRTYNSLTPMDTNAFGRSWSTALDWRLSTAALGFGVVTVTDPTNNTTIWAHTVDGPTHQEYGPQQGASGKLVHYNSYPLLGPIWLLTDHAGSTFAFYGQEYAKTNPGVVGKIRMITDDQNRSLLFSYTPSGNLTTMTNAATGRALHFTWDTTSWPGTPLVGSVSTDPVTIYDWKGNPQPTKQTYTWSYFYDKTYAGHYLTAACGPMAKTLSAPFADCTTYTYSKQVDSKGAWDTNMPAQLATVQSPMNHRANNPQGHDAYDVQLTYWPVDDPHAPGGVRNVCDARQTSACADNGTYAWLYTYDFIAGTAYVYRGKATDPNGHATTWEYDLGGRLTTTTFADGSKTSNRYEWTDSTGHPQTNNHFLSATTDELGHGVSFTTDANGNVTSTSTETTPAGATTKTYSQQWFAYDANNHLTVTRGPGSTSATDDTYSSITFANADGLVGSQAGPKNVDGNRALTFKYYTTGTETVPIPATTVPACTTGAPQNCQPKGLVAKTCGPTFDANNRCATYTLYQYDNIGQLIRTASDQGAVTRMAYDELGRMVHKWDNFCATVSCPAGQRDWFQEFDGNGNVIRSIDPATTDANGLTTGEKHQKRTDVVFDLNGRAIKTTISDVGGSKAPDASRTVSVTYDDAGRVIAKTDASGVTTMTTYDAVGNVASTTSATGLVTSYIYDARDRLTDTWVKNFTDDPVTGTSTARDIHASHVTYYANGKQQSVTDALGNTITTTYTADGLPDTVTLSQYHASADPSDVVTNVTLARTTYDATRHAQTQTAYDGQGNAYSTTITYDATGHPISQVSGPSSDPTTSKSWGFDPYGHPQYANVSRPSTAATDQRTVAVAETDAYGRVVKEGTRVLTGLCATCYVDMVTQTQYDKWNNVLTTLDTRGTNFTDSAHITSFRYNEVGQVVKTTAPQVAVETVNATAGTATPGSARPTSYANYNTYGEATFAMGATGAQAKTTYDNAGRVIATYGTDPSTSDPTAPLVQLTGITYHPATGQVSATTDALGRTTTYQYDALGRTLVTTSPKDLHGKQVSARVWYDDLNRPIFTASPFAYASDPKSYDSAVTYNETGQAVATTSYATAGTTKFQTTASASYDLLGRARKTVAADGTITVPTFDAYGRTVKTTVTPPGNAVAPQTSSVDAIDTFGHALQTTDALGVITKTNYDAWGRPTTSAIYAPNTATAPTAAITQTTATPIAQRANTYSFPTMSNAVSTALTTNLPAVPDTVTTMSFDANAYAANPSSPAYAANVTTVDNAGRTIRVATPTSMPGAPPTYATTTYGYDVAGRMVRATDGRGNTTYYTYNAAGLAQSTIEPATTATPTVAQRTYTRTYTKAGAPLTDTQPGGVTVTRAYDTGVLTNITATGGGLAGATRTFDYDAFGRMTSFGAPTGNYTVAYDSRGLVTKVAPPAGRGQDQASYTYDALGRIVSQSDAAGTHNYTYTAAGQVNTITEPLTASTETYAYNQQTGLPSTLTFTNAKGATTESFAYDALGRLSNKAFTAQGSVTPTYALSIDQRDANGNIVKQSIAGTNATGAGQYTYGYDTGGRLASYTAPGTATTTYGYDAAGNRTQAGTTTFAYDARNRLTGSSTGDSYTYNDRGDLTKAIENTKTSTFAYDALGRLASAGTGTSTVNYAYDSLDRVTNRNSTQFTYIGATSQLATTGNQTISYLADGTIDAVKTGNAASLAIQNGHGDLAATFDPGATSPKSSAVFDPYGKSTTNTNDLGFQGQYTDPATGLVWMNARWYSPTTGTFGARDSVLGDTNQPASMNRYAYANGNPVMNADPSGNCVVSSCMTSNQASSANRVTGGHASSCSPAGLSATQDWGAVACGNVVVYPNGSMQYSPLWTKQADLQEKLNARFAPLIAGAWIAGRAVAAWAYGACYSSPHCTTEEEAQASFGAAFAAESSCGLYAGTCLQDTLAHYAADPFCSATKDPMKCAEHTVEADDAAALADDSNVGMWCRAHWGRDAKDIRKCIKDGHPPVNNAEWKSVKPFLVWAGKCEIGVPYGLEPLENLYEDCVKPLKPYFHAIRHTWNDGFWGKVKVIGGAVAAVGAIACTAATAGVCGFAVGEVGGMAAVGLGAFNGAMAGGLAYTAVTLPLDKWTTAGFVKGLAVGGLLGTTSTVTRLAASAGQLQKLAISGGVNAAASATWDIVQHGFDNPARIAVDAAFSFVSGATTSGIGLQHDSVLIEMAASAAVGTGIDATRQQLLDGSVNWTNAGIAGGVGALNSQLWGYGFRRNPVLLLQARAAEETIASNSRFLLPASGHVWKFAEKLFAKPTGTFATHVTQQWADDR